jgi:hypothetical protein
MVVVVILVPMLDFIFVFVLVIMVTMVAIVALLTKCCLAPPTLIFHNLAYGALPLPKVAMVAIVPVFNLRVPRLPWLSSLPWFP